MKVKQWIRGLLAAVITSAATAASTVVTAPDVLEAVGWEPVGRIALGGGLIALLAYLKRSPLPSQGGTED